MGDLQRVYPGQDFEPKAEDWNAFIDAAKFVKNQGLGGNSKPYSTDPAVVLVKNNTGADQDQFAVLGVDGPIITPAANLPEFKRRVALTCSVPDLDTADHEGRWVVLAEPLAAGMIGRAFATGLVAVQLWVDGDASDGWRGAECRDGATVAELTEVGYSTVVWRDGLSTGGGFEWAVIHLGQPTDSTDVTGTGSGSGSGGGGGPCSNCPGDPYPNGPNGRQCAEGYTAYALTPSGDCGCDGTGSGSGSGSGSSCPFICLPDSAVGDTCTDGSGSGSGGAANCDGEPCSSCPDNPPPLWLMEGAFENAGGCTDCTDLNGSLLTQDVAGACGYTGPVVPTCWSNPEPILSITDTQIILTVDDGNGHSATYVKARTTSDDCHTEHTLTLDSESGSGCTFPASVTIKPAKSADPPENYELCNTGGPTL